MATDSTRRSLRTGIDAILTVLTALLAVVAYPGLPDLLDSALGRPGATVAIGVVLGALLLFFTKVRNALEDRGKIPALLKAPASPGADPVPDPRDARGHVDLATVLLVIAIALLLLVAVLVARTF